MVSAREGQGWEVAVAAGLVVVPALSTGISGGATRQEGVRHSVAQALARTNASSMYYLQCDKMPRAFQSTLFPFLLQECKFHVIPD